MARNLTSNSISAIDDGCRALGQQYDKETIEKYSRLLGELERWGARINLTAIRERDDMVSAHLLDCLAVRSYLQGTSIVDIGTGAGFPGLPLAIAEPARAFVLLDSNGKKIAFVKHIVATLGLANVTTIHARAEDYAPEAPFDTVIARALATISGIIAFGGHLTGKKGVLLALKGKYPAEELELVDKLPDQWDWSVDKINVPGLPRHSRHIVRLSKRD